MIFPLAASKFSGISENNAANNKDKQFSCAACFVNQSQYPGTLWRKNFATATMIGCRASR